MTNRPAAAYASVLVATLVWGTLHPIGKLILLEATATQLALARALLPAIVLTVALVLAGRSHLLRAEIARRPATIVGLGLLSFSLSSGLSMAGLALLPASISSLLANTSPLMLAIGLVAGSWRWPSAGMIVGLAIGFGGVAILVVRPDAAHGALEPAGVVLSLAGSACWAIYTGWSRQVLSDADPLVLTALSASAGAVPLFILTIMRGEAAGMASLSERTLVLILYAGVVGTAVTYALWLTALRRLSATNVIAFQYVIPLTSVTIAVAVLGEPIDARLVAGGLAILVGVAIAQEMDWPRRLTRRLVSSRRRIDAG
ncbi:MAG TPA: DMT family transporter [Chloroflexota bacterium]|nr:DMT family transporter [Chloroflexota bacterium]